ncbi:MAG: hypothetical protein BWY63_01843 [Chloroflexi bacterium ADurb.Bin360]|nr:MAG: hypothetical protein BWY63_01843 [Chloroflexi bacterium ADurb.Bin360]
MTHKFESLEVWKLALEYVNMIYAVSEALPRSEEFNLKSQITRAATSIALNIAEGSTSQNDPEQARFLGLATRSLIETVACQHLIHQRSYLQDLTPLRDTYRSSQTLFYRLQAFRKSLVGKSVVRENELPYEIDFTLPF